ncbi:hypothetical protein ACCAA_1120022 [Candidatus Accumulibacter aalborgensis]|uniref:Uncharacterized protein n=1 Tax=Candidatus Accumulibacter aalborgensis TaxID=1860102 RepID=A0A1A8XHC4_9PROT|nr:hypothetical protein ACCAA_1120022 [Candidatus Accumulibacter aalborgensis]
MVLCGHRMARTKRHLPLIKPGEFTMLERSAQEAVSCRPVDKIPTAMNDTDTPTCSS